MEIYNQASIIYIDALNAEDELVALEGKVQHKASLLIELKKHPIHVVICNDPDRVITLQTTQQVFAFVGFLDLVVSAKRSADHHYLAG